MNYDKQKFLNILDKLKASFGSQNKMAETLELSSSYITKIYDENTKNPPAPEYLKKIAENSNGITTYEELMSICGYLNDCEITERSKSRLQQIIKLANGLSVQEVNYLIKQLNKSKIQVKEGEEC